MNNRCKVLVSAYACNPYKGSEEGVGWGWVKAIARYHNPWVITAEFHRKDIEKESRKNPETYRNITFCYVPRSFWHYAPSSFWNYVEGSFFKPIMNKAYRLWLNDAFSLGLELHRKIKFDLAHQITYVGFRFPGHLWELDIPFVWGPIGGLENTPWRLLPSLGLYGCAYFGARNIINLYDKIIMKAPKLAFKKAGKGVIAATEGIRQQILQYYGEDSTVICEIGPPPQTATQHSQREAREPLKLGWSGIHTEGKNLPLLLRALRRIPSGIHWQLHILGRGPCTAKWKRLARAIGVNQHCQWHGQIPRQDAINIMHQSHIFIATSLKDLTSTVLLEALGQGVPVICLDHCGFSDVVNWDCGIKLPVTTPRDIEFHLTEAIARLAIDEVERCRLAKGALRRSMDFSWEKKSMIIDSIYRRAIKEHFA